MRKPGDTIQGIFTLGGCLVGFCAPAILVWSAFYWLRYGDFPRMRLVDFVALPRPSTWEGFNVIVALIWQAPLIFTMPCFGLVIYWIGLLMADAERREAGLK